MTDLTESFKQEGFTFRKIKSNPLYKGLFAGLLIAGGAALIVFPGIGTEIAVMGSGAAMVILGVCIIFADALKRLKNVSAYALPALLITFGSLLILFRVFTAAILAPLIIGLWSLTYGIKTITKGFKMKAHGGYWKSQTALGAILIVLGAAVLITMAMGGNAIGVLLGFALIAFALPLLKKTDAQKTA